MFLAALSEWAVKHARVLSLKRGCKKKNRIVLDRRRNRFWRFMGRTVATLFYVFTGNIFISQIKSNRSDPAADSRAG